MPQQIYDVEAAGEYEKHAASGQEARQYRAYIDTPKVDVGRATTRHEPRAAAAGIIASRLHDTEAGQPRAADGQWGIAAADSRCRYGHHVCATRFQPVRYAAPMPRRRQPPRRKWLRIRRNDYAPSPIMPIESPASRQPRQPPPMAGTPRQLMPGRRRATMPAAERALAARAATGEISGYASHARQSNEPIAVYFDYRRRRNVSSHKKSAKG